MQFFLINIKSKSFKSLSNFLKFIIFYFNKITKTLIKKLKFQKLKKNKFSLLKSPHVHKKAQEHLEQLIYKKKILIIFFNLPAVMFFLFFKKLLDFSFFEVTLKLKYFVFKSNLKFLLRFLNLNNLILLGNKTFYSNKFFLNKIIFYKNKNFKIYSFLKSLNIIGLIYKKK